MFKGQRSLYAAEKRALDWQVLSGLGTVEFDIVNAVLFLHMAV